MWSTPVDFAKKLLYGLARGCTVDAAHGCAVGRCVCACAAQKRDAAKDAARVHCARRERVWVLALRVCPGVYSRGLGDTGCRSMPLTRVLLPTGSALAAVLGGLTPVRRINWQLLVHACGSISTIIATAYDTLGPAGLTHSLNEPSCAALFTNAELLPTLLAVLPNTPTVKGDIKVLLIEELRQRRKAATVEADVLEVRQPKSETVSCIMYTSGSTGAPKGIVITHANLVASVGAVYTLLGHHLTPDDAYLPLAHILKYVVELCMLFVGMPTGFGRIKTLTDARCGGGEEVGGAGGREARGQRSVEQGKGGDGEEAADRDEWGGGDFEGDVGVSECGIRCA
ncbi:hypothetical protein B0H16DRAFT_1475280 [Mycena metata]|uniref:AMP-dependent synthetase/ligase domain-containing protein n=1 Tax=Mycena metata TaxID=1033252 RepID=A0AAD7HET0_9AGAR|nr:hypothetical protein B0H16DRAFT_1475280 [Mycena metata]